MAERAEVALQSLVGGVEHQVVRRVEAGVEGSKRSRWSAPTPYMHPPAAPPPRPAPLPALPPSRPAPPRSAASLSSAAHYSPHLAILDHESGEQGAAEGRALRRHAASRAVDDLIHHLCKCGVRCAGWSGVVLVVVAVVVACGRVGAAQC